MCAFNMIKRRLRENINDMKLENYLVDEKAN